MYYSHPCSYCRRIFFTHSRSKSQASRVLYRGIKKHLINYNEDHKEYDFDDGEKIDSNEVYANLTITNHRPSGGYEI